MLKKRGFWKEAVPTYKVTIIGKTGKIIEKKKLWEDHRDRSLARLMELDKNMTQVTATKYQWGPKSLW